MSLATRCTACGTVFRVVQDQLKISEGWVRCGRCKDVFNALEGLFDLEREAPSQWKPLGDAPAPPESAAAPEGHAAVEDEALPVALRAASSDVPPAQPVLDAGLPREPEPEPLAADVIDSEPGDSRDFADARFNTELALDEAEADLDAAPPSAAAAEAPPAVEDEPAPSFLRETTVQSPAVRLALGAAAFVLAALLAAQALLHERDRVAAAWPASRALLATACEALGCRIEPPRRIEDIAVESSALTRATGPGDALRLVVALRNRGALALAMPTLDLSLTDANGELVARRALSAAELHSASRTLAPAAETSLQALLSNPGGRVTGYTVEVFYP